MYLGRVSPTYQYHHRDRENLGLYFVASLPVKAISVAITVDGLTIVRLTGDEESSFSSGAFSVI